MADQLRTNSLEQGLVSIPTVNSYAEKAKQVFLQGGFPSKKLEDWHYTSPSEVVKSRTFVQKPEQVYLSADLLTRIEKASHRIVFFGNEISHDLTNVKFELANQEGTDIKDGMLAAGVLRFQKNIIVNSRKLDCESLHVFIVGQGQDLESASLKILIDASDSLNVISEVVDCREQISSLVIPRISVHLSRDSKCLWLHLQNQNENSSQYSYLVAEAVERSHFHFLGLAVGGKQVRNDMQVHILGPEAEIILDGVVLGSGSQHFDQTTGIHHHVGGSQSSQMFKSVLDEKSRSAFSGTVYIAKDAQKAQSEQVNHNLLLSDFAEADSRPMLKIYADDVKAGHGSTVGQINSEELFYLQSRAISKEKATEMLAYGFAAEIPLKIQDLNLRGYAEKLLRSKFQKMSKR